ncbi:tyrosine-type recombinase/integrase [Bradyrhizobium sp. Pha-3]|uniref:tyrosine-type recombinase/integrase n=1 Tax=Bradyrhizobium TaxID=374 RepID=UPI0035D508D5
MRRKLSDTYVRQLPKAPKGKRVDVFDTEVPGFGVRVTETGHKTYFLFKKWPGCDFASRREITNAHYVEGNKKKEKLDDEKSGVEAARIVARDWAAKVALGVDPHAERRAKAAAEKLARQQAKDIMFEVLAEKWFATIRGQRRGREVEKDFGREYVERFRGRPVNEITKAEIRDMIEAKAIIHPAQARNLLGYGKRFFTWLVDRDIIASSPVQLLFAKKMIGERVKRERVLSDGELRAVWSAAGELGYPYGPIIRLLILTGQRRSEVGDAVWSEFDLAKREWTIPGARMKKKKGHLVPYTVEMAAILADLPRFKGGEYLFSARDHSKPVNGFAKCKERIDKLTGEFKEPWVFHDIRRTVRTNLSDIDELSKEIRERIVAHAQGAMSDTYDHYEYAKQKRRGFELWSARLHTILHPPDSNVVALRA